MIIPQDKLKEIGILCINAIIEYGSKSEIRLPPCGTYDVYFATNVLAYCIKEQSRIIEEQTRYLKNV